MDIVKPENQLLIPDLEKGGYGCKKSNGRYDDFYCGALIVMDN